MVTKEGRKKGGEGGKANEKMRTKEGKEGRRRKEGDN
jgi:hypothetical protein